MLQTHTTSHFVWLALALLTSACSSNIPLEIRQKPVDALSLSQAQDQPDEHKLKTVRWGGRILETVNGKDSSKLTIVAFPLMHDGRPTTDKTSTGRFIATANYFLEPQEYKTKQLITVTGTYAETIIQNIGEYPYNYPVVNITHSYLWPKKIIRSYPIYPAYWYHNPWYHQRYYRTTSPSLKPSKIK
jgi:outer membrane lipoprotein